MGLLSSRLIIDTVNLNSSIFYHNYSQPDLPRFIHKFCDQIKLEEPYDFHELDNNKELKIIHEIDKYDKIKLKRSRNVFLLQFLNYEFKATQFVTNYYEDELYTCFINNDDEIFVMHPQIDLIKIISHRNSPHNSLNIYTSFIIKEEYIQEFRERDKLTLKKCKNKNMLRQFYNRYGLNRDEKSHHKLIINLLKDEMGILHSTEPDTIEDLEELALTKLWIGMNGK